MKDNGFNLSEDTPLNMTLSEHCVLNFDNHNVVFLGGKYQNGTANLKAEILHIGEMFGPPKTLELKYPSYHPLDYSQVVPGSQLTRNRQSSSLAGTIYKAVI